MVDHVGRLVDWLRSLDADDWRRYIFLLLAAYVVYRLTCWLLRTFLPWLLGHILFPLVAGVVCALCAVVLVVQTVGVVPFRGFGVRPPGFLFSLGDLAIGGIRRSVAAVPYWSRRMDVLKLLPGFAVLIVMVTLGWYGHQIVCETQPHSPWCTGPAAAVNSLGDEAWRQTVTTARDAFAR